MHHVGAEEIKGVLVCDKHAFLQKIQRGGPRHRLVADQLNVKKVYGSVSAGLENGFGHTTLQKST